MLTDHAERVLDSLARRSIEQYQTEKLLATLTDPIKYKETEGKLATLTAEVNKLSNEWDNVRQKGADVVK